MWPYYEKGSFKNEYYRKMEEDILPEIIVENDEDEDKENEENVKDKWNRILQIIKALPKKGGAFFMQRKGGWAMWR